MRRSIASFLSASLLVSAPGLPCYQAAAQTVRFSGETPAVQRAYVGNAAPETPALSEPPVALAGMALEPAGDLHLPTLVPAAPLTTAGQAIAAPPLAQTLPAARLENAPRSPAQAAPGVPASSPATDKLAPRAPAVTVTGMPAAAEAAPEPTETGDGNRRTVETLGRAVKAQVPGIVLFDAGRGGPEAALPVADPVASAPRPARRGLLARARDAALSAAPALVPGALVFTQQQAGPDTVMSVSVNPDGMALYAWLAAGAAALAAVVVALRQTPFSWLKTAGWSALWAGLTFGAGLSVDVFTGPADLWLKIAVGVAWAGAGVLGGFYWRSAWANKVWLRSKSAQDAARVDEARAAGDAAALESLANEARARRTRIEGLIADAEGAGVKTVANATSDPVALAKRYAAFDGLVAARAALNQNAVSTDPRHRMGGNTPASWRERLTPEEAQAKASGFEGRLALTLKGLSAEIRRETEAGEAAAADLKRFGEYVPALFGGRMKEEARRGEKDMEEYRTQEVQEEQTLFDAVNGPMRKRVSDRIYSESPEFRSHRDRFDRLATLQDGPLKGAVDTARGVDSDLGSTISHLSSEQMYLALAAANTHVPVTKTRTRSDGSTETYTEYEDRSGTYRALAAMEAMSAASSASSARSGLERLRGLMVALYNDPTVASENLRGALPGQADGSVGGPGALGPLTDWFLPPLFGLFSSLGSEWSVRSARGGFAPVLQALEGVNSEVGSRRGQENAWVNARIDEDLERQMARVPAGEVAFFQAELANGSPYKGTRKRGLRSDIPRMARAAARGAKVHEVMLLDGEGFYKGTAKFRVDARLEPLLPQGFLEELYHQASLAHGDAFLALNGQEPVTLLLLDRSPGPFELYPQERAVGVNRAVFEVKDSEVRRAFLITGLGHELRQLLEPERSEEELTRTDAALFTQLLEAPWRRPAAFLQETLGLALAPASPFLAAAAEWLGLLRLPDAPLAKHRMAHKFSHPAGTRAEREKLRGFETAFADSATPLGDAAWTQTDSLTDALLPLGQGALAGFLVKTLPALMDFGAGGGPGAGSAERYASGLKQSVDALLALDQLPEGRKLAAHAAADGLPPILRLLGGRPELLPESLSLLRELHQAEKPGAGRGGRFGLHGRAEEALKGRPEDLPAFLYISRLFIENGIDPLPIQFYPRLVHPSWSIPQALTTYPALARLPDGSRALRLGEADISRLTAFMRWASALTDRRLDFSVAYASAEHAERLLAAIRAEGLPVEVLARGEGGLRLALNLNAPDGEAIEKKIMEGQALVNKDPGRYATPAREPRAPGSAEDRRNREIILGKSVDYAQKLWAARDGLHQYAHYHVPLPIVLARIFGGEKAGAYYRQAETELEARQKANDRNLSLEDYKKSEQTLADDLLAAGHADDAKRHYRRAAWAPNVLEIARSLAAKGENEEALLYVDYLVSHVQDQLRNGLKAHVLIEQLQELEKTARAPGFVWRINTLWRRLILEQLSDIDRGLERTVNDGWDRLQADPVPPATQIGIAAFLEQVAVHPRNTMRDMNRMGDVHARYLEGLTQLIEATAGNAALQPFILETVDRLWDSPAKWALYDKIIPHLPEGLRETLLSRRMESVERYASSAGAPGDRVHSLAVYEGAKALLENPGSFEQGRRMLEALPQDPQAPDKEITVWEHEVFGLSGGFGLRTQSHDQRLLRLRGLLALARHQKEPYLEEALQLAAQVSLAAPFTDGLWLQRYEAVRDFIREAAQLGDIERAELALRTLRTDVRNLEARPDYQALAKDSHVRDAVKRMTAELGAFEALLAVQEFALGRPDSARARLEAYVRQGLPVSEATMAARELSQRPDSAPYAERLYRMVVGLQTLSSAIPAEEDDRRWWFSSTANLAEKIIEAPGLSAQARASLFHDLLAALLEAHRRDRREQEERRAASLEYGHEVEALVGLLKLADRASLASERSLLLKELADTLTSFPLDPEWSPSGWPGDLYELAGIAVAPSPK